MTNERGRSAGGLTVILLLALGAAGAAAVGGLVEFPSGEGRLAPTIVSDPAQNPAIPFAWSAEGIPPDRLQELGFEQAFRTLLLLALGVFATGVGSAAVLAAQRGSSRRRDRAVRGLVGAAPARLLARGLAGALGLGAAGAALALLVAVPAARMLRESWPGRVVEGAGTGFGGGAVPVAVAVLGGLLVAAAAVLPHLRVLRPGWLGDALAPHARTNPGVGPEATERALVAAQALLGVTLVYGTAVLLAGDAGGGSVDGLPPGLSLDGVLVVEVAAEGGATPGGWGGEERRRAYRTLLDRVTALPEVEAAGLASRGALGGRGTVDWVLSFSPLGLVGVHAEHHAVGAEWLEVLGVVPPPRASSGGAVMVNPTMAWLLGWVPDTEGSETLPLRLGGARGVPVRAVGVLPEDLPVAAPGWGRPYRLYPNGVVRTREPPVVYLALEEHPPSRAELLVKPVGSASPVSVDLRDALTDAVRDAGLEVGALDPLPARLERMGAVGRWLGGVVGGLGTAAIALAAIGVAGVYRSAARRRIAELGLRRAVGGGRGRVVCGVLAELAAPLAVGAWFGFGTSLACGQALSAFLAHGPRFDVWLYLASVLVVGAAAMLGAIGPVLRATSLPPARAIGLGEEVEGGGLA